MYMTLCDVEISETEQNMYNNVLTVQCNAVGIQSLVSSSTMIIGAHIHTINTLDLFTTRLKTIPWA